MSGDEPDQLRAVLRMSCTAMPGAALVLAAAFVPADVRPVLWAVAFLAGMFGPNLFGLRGWRVNPTHFAERHGLIIVIAIGESLVSIGFGARSTHLSASVITAAVLGLVVAASFWLAYFDFASGGIEHLLAQHRARHGSPSPVTRTRTCICRWWPGSCSSGSRCVPRSLTSVSICP
ncbi:MAG TPA: low temperature requirement protein A [Mycobacteriales bacterium]|nr:low temperature requirement protein A [Mycobacteriales bacterium]